MKRVTELEKQIETLRKALQPFARFVDGDTVRGRASNRSYKNAQRALKGEPLIPPHGEQRV